MEIPSLQNLAIHELKKIVGKKIYDCTMSPNFTTNEIFELQEHIKQITKSQQIIKNISIVVQQSELATSHYDNVVMLKRDANHEHIRMNIRQSDEEIWIIRFTHLHILSFWIEITFIYNKLEFQLICCKGRIEDFSGNFENLTKVTSLYPRSWSGGQIYNAITNSDTIYDYGIFDYWQTTITRNSNGILDKVSFISKNNIVHMEIRDSHCFNFLFSFDICLNFLLHNK